MPQTYSRVTRLGQRIDMLGFTLQELAEESGVDRWALNDYLRHGKAITPSHLMKLCQTLRCEPETLIG